jgi:hypothetical protein
VRAQYVKRETIIFNITFRVFNNILSFYIVIIGARVKMNKRNRIRYAISLLSADNPFLLIKEGFGKIKDRRNSNANVSLFDALMIVINQATQGATRRKQMQKLVIDVLPRYGLNVDNIRYISESVNTVFQVEAEGLKYKLRIHPPNQRSSAEIQAELLWLLALRTDIGLGVPEPVPAKDGTFVQEVPFSKTPHLRQIVLFKWLDGTFLSNHISPCVRARIGTGWIIYGSPTQSCQTIQFT